MISDICLVLEGTFPYVSGGVSSWVYDIIRQMKDLSFSILYIGPQRPDVKKMHYDMPANVVEFQEIYLFDYKSRVIPKKKHISHKKAKIIRDFFASVKSNDTSLFDEFIKEIIEDSDITIYDLAHSIESWDIITDLYREEARGLSFLDYFWTWRFIYLPFFSLLQQNIPRARLYHSVSTGYAGIMTALGKLQNKRPFLLTEHGIYTKERDIEISRADWIHSELTNSITVKDESEEFFKTWWTQFFSFFSTLSYDRADKIITLYEGNRQIQLSEGADIAKTMIVPNGIDINRFQNVVRKKTLQSPLKVGLIGRVVPIKDIKTFIRSCKIIHDNFDKEVEFYVIGPEDEEPYYYKECIELAQIQRLEDVLHFTGKVDGEEYYASLDVVVLTSISEAQPLVILEAHACGIPFVASNVGACMEMLYGSSPDDKLLGKSGIITNLCDPHDTASAIIKILSDENLYNEMSRVAKKRVTNKYLMDDMVTKYYKLYSQYLEEVTWQA